MQDSLNDMRDKKQQTTNLVWIKLRGYDTCKIEMTKAALGLKSLKIHIKSLLKKQKCETTKTGGCQNIASTTL